MVRASVVCVILLVVCFTLPTLAQAPVDQPNELRCTNAAACKKGTILVVATPGGSATETSSIVSQAGGIIKVAGSETVTHNITAGGNVAATGNVSGANVAATGSVTAGAQGAFGVALNPSAQEEGFASGSSTELSAIM